VLELAAPLANCPALSPAAADALAAVKRTKSQTNNSTMGIDELTPLSRRCFV
jgi:hypothetical protein